jgi:glucosylceramidase
MKVTHIKSTDRAKWQVGEIGNECYADTIKLTGVKKQTLKGFGGCFNELGWEALSKLSEKGRNTYFGELFGEENCGFNNGRVPIGANDLSVSWYSCDETDGDFELKDFNIERDKQRTIPFVKEALKRQPDMTVFASPWSPPTWMKTRKVFNFGTLRQEEPYQLAYAKYLLKFVDAYKDAGIAIKQLHVQNEVFADQKFASCLWTAEEMRDFMKNYLGPEAEKQGKLQDLELWLGTINGPFVDIRIGAMYGSPLSQFYDQFENTILSDSNAAKYITGVAFQWGGKHVIEETELSYPEFRYMMSESECGGGDNSWEDAEYIFRQMWHYFRHGAESYIYWNLAMPEDNSSTWGWRQNALATVTDDGTLNWNPEFFLMKHLSHFAKPGAKYLETAGHLAANTIAFENPDGTVALIVGSNMQTERAFTFEYQGNHFSAIIEPHSIHSFLIGD